jgi:hypothetical protein
MRFAEAEAAARRVHVSDLGIGTDPNHRADKVIDLKVAENPGAARKLARLKAQVKGNRIESMELFDDKQASLCRIKYEYERGGDASPLSRLVADLPVRPERLGIDAKVTSASPRGEKNAYEVREVDHVSHKGGRTCTVVYKDVTIGDKTLRLPVQIEARAGDDHRLLRSARLMNFKRVDLDKAGVWKSAIAFAHMSNEDWAFYKLAGKYLSPKPQLGPMKVDPNDLAFVRGLIAKYPVYDPKSAAEARREAKASAPEKVSKPSRPPKMDIDPNDARVIRQLAAYYEKQKRLAMKEEMQKTKGRAIHVLDAQERERSDLAMTLRRILMYHHVPPLAEDQAPPLEAKDRESIRQLQAYYEKLVTQQDRGLGGQLKALHALTRFDRILKDWDAFEIDTARYLKMIQEAGLRGAYMVGGHGNIETFVEAGRYEKANKLLVAWADKSAAENGPDAVSHFAGWDVEGSKYDPWASVQLLDRFLKKMDLSPLQRYEGLALKAIALHRVERLLSDPETNYDELGKAQAQWILSTTNRSEVAKKVEAALREALSAWQSLGPARTSEAKPYSTDSLPPRVQNMMGYPEATKLQEVSAQLDSIIRERTGQKTGGKSKTNR